MRNLSSLRSEFKNHLKTSSISDARINVLANEAVNMVARNVDLAHLLTEISFSSAASTRRYYLETDILKILSLYDLTNDCEIQNVAAYRIDRADPDRGDIGTPYMWEQGPMTEYLAQLSSASTITIVSSSASDTSQKVRINGVVSGVEDTELITLNGTSSVAGSKSFSSVHGIRKDEATTGKITVTATTGGTTLALLAPKKIVTQYQTVDLFPVPSAVLSYRIKCYRVPFRMSNDQDVPEIPEIYEQVVFIALLMLGREELQDFKRADELRLIFDRELTTLKANQGATRNKRRIYGGGGGVEISRLGPNYPAEFLVK